MATEHEEHRNHREMLAATLYAHVAQRHPEVDAVSESLRLADKLIARNRATGAVDIDGRTGEPVR